VGVSLAPCKGKSFKKHLIKNENSLRYVKLLPLQGVWDKTCETSVPLTSLTPHKDNFFKICIKRLENNKKRVTFATKTKDFDQ